MLPNGILLKYGQSEIVILPLITVNWRMISYHSEKVIILAKEMVLMKTFMKWHLSKYFHYTLNDDKHIEENKCILTVRNGQK